jgi:hypothetical protein
MLQDRTPQPPTPPTPPTPPSPPSPPDIPTPTTPAEPPIVFRNDGNPGVRVFTIKDGKLVIERVTGQTQTIAIDRLVPSGAVDIVQAIGATLLLLIVGFPISRAIARWIDRKSAAPHIPVEVSRRMEHLEETLDSVALSVERISEGQRFTTRVLASEQREPVPVQQARP